MDPYVVEPARRSRWWWAAGWVALAAVIAGLGMNLADGATTPEDELADVIAFVREHRTARFEETSRTELELPEDFSDDVPEGFRRVHTSRSEGELDIAGSLRRHTTQDGFTTDEIQLPGVSYVRSTFEGETTPWQRHPSGDDDWAEVFADVIEREQEQAEGDGVSSMFLLAVGHEQWPYQLLIDAAATGTVTSPDPGVLRIAYRQRSFLTEEEQALLDRVRDEQLRRQFDEERVLVVEHGSGGRLDVVRQEERNSTRATRFHDWGVAVRIDAPPDAEVDVTPSIDEEGLLAMVPGPVLAVTDLPAGWTLVSGRVDEREEDEPACTYATLAYGPGDDLLDAAATVATVDGACELLGGIGDLAEGEPARFGAYDAFLHRDDGFAWFSSPIRNPEVSAAVRIPQGWALVSTTEGEDVLARLVASLAPYDPASAPTASSTEKAPS